MGSDITLSVVVPLYNEALNVEPLVAAVERALVDVPGWELLLVDDGSSDATAEIALSLASADPRVHLLRLARNYGQTAAMQAGFDQAKGDVVVTMDGDLQNDPDDIPLLLAKLDEGYDLVAGYRVRRQDALVRRKIPSYVANRLIGWITGVPIRDNGCSLKAYRRKLLDRLHLYSDMHRFIPALAAATAGARIAELPARHHPRRHGKSKYGLSRIVKVLIDLMTIKMIRSFRERPLQLFATGAFFSFLLGLGFSAATLVAVISFRSFKATAVVFPGVALLWFGLACYLLMLGLIGEVAVREDRRAEEGGLGIIRKEVT
jgi:glycosyltransferase involved in cell wall biosynthesis